MTGKELPERDFETEHFVLDFIRNDITNCRLNMSSTIAHVQKDHGRDADADTHIMHHFDYIREMDSIAAHLEEMLRHLKDALDARDTL